MYKVIVVGTDGSDTARVAVHQATALASRTGATLHIVHAAPRHLPGVIAFAASGGVSELAAADKNKAIGAESKRICEDAASEARELSVEVRIHTVPHEPADALIATAKEVGADLLVVGNRGMTGARRVLGSVPNTVSHHSPCSLLIVDTTAHDAAAAASAADGAHEHSS